MENGESKQKWGGVALPQILASDGGFANACPEGEAHGGCLGDLLTSASHTLGGVLQTLAGDIATLGGDHVACCLEGLLLGHVVCLNCVYYKGGSGGDGGISGHPLDCHSSGPKAHSRENASRSWSSSVKNQSGRSASSSSWASI